MHKSSALEEDIFLEALELPSTERLQFVREKCADDSTLAERVSALLRGYEENSDYLETPPNSGSLGNSPASKIDAADDLKPGDRIGDYQLVERIGEGGCGVVYLAEQQAPMRRRVALKVIKLGMDTQEFVARFEAERQALALMDHANIARVFDAGATPAGRPYFTMELARGLPITRYCDEHQLSTDQRLELFISVCRAIQHAHQKGIIHRDLKPSNILVAMEDGQAVPKVIDFGIAKALHAPLTDKTLATRRHAFVGTPAYTSPEQIESEAFDVDTRTDIYSLGVLLYELLTGHQPFDRGALERAGLQETRRIIREVEPPRPSARLNSLSHEQRETVGARRGVEAGRLSILLRSDLDWIVMRCLEKDRTRRYETAAALATDLEHYLENKPVVARPPSRAYRLGKFVRRYKTGVAAASIVGVSLVAGLITAGVLLSREKAARERALAAEQAEVTLRRQAEEARKEETRRATRAIIDLANERFAQGRTPDGLAYLVSAARTDPANPTIAPRLASVLTSRNFLLPEAAIARHSSPVMTVEYSNDGSRLVALWEDGTLGRIDLTTGALETERTPGNSHFGFTRMRTNRFLLLYSPDGVIRPIDRETGKVTREMHFEFDPMGCRAVDHTSDLFTTKLTSNTIMVADAADGRIITTRVPYDGALGVGPKWITWAFDGTNAPTRKVRFLPTDKENREMTVEFPVAIHHGSKLATSPDGRRVASVQPNEKGEYFLHLWALPDCTPVMSPQRMERWTSAFYNPDGRFLICWGKGLDVFDAETGRKICRMPSAGSFVDETRYVFSPDGRTLVTWGEADVVNLWDLESGSLRVAPLRHGGNINRVSFSDNGKVLLTTSDGFTRVWDPATGALLAEPTVPLHSAPAVTLSPDGTQLMIGTSEGAIYRFRLGPSGAQPLKLARARELPASFLPGNPTRVLWMNEDRARIIDVTSGREMGPGIRYPEPIRAAKMRDDGKVIVVQTTSGQWRAWWLGENEVKRVVAIGEESTELAGIIFNPAREQVGLSRADRMRVWSLETGEPAGPEIGTAVNLGWARSASFSPDGQRVIVGSNQGRARVWDVATGQARIDFGIQPTRILFGVFSPDGTRIATGNRNGETRLWDANTGTPLTPIVRQRGMNGEAVFSRDSRLVATYAADTVLKVLDVGAGGKVVRSMEADGALKTVRFSTDGERLVTATAEGTAQVWDVATGVPVTETMRHGSVRITSAELSHDGRFVRTETAPEGSFCFWSVPPPLPSGAVTPAWLIELATLYAGKRLNAQGQLESVPDAVDALRAVREQIGGLPDGSPYIEWGRWVLSDWRTRPIAPGFATILRESALRPE